jgi:hypothetical protein
MKVYCVVDHRYVDTFIHVTSPNSSLKTLNLSFWVEKKTEKRMNQIVQDSARSYGIRYVSRLENSILAKSPQNNAQRIEMNYEITDVAEKIEQMMFKGGFLYRRYICLPF